MESSNEVVYIFLQSFLAKNKFSCYVTTTALVKFVNALLVDARFLREMVDARSLI